MMRDSRDHHRRFDWLTALNAVLSSAIVVYMLHVERDLADLSAKVSILLAASGIEMPRPSEPSYPPPRDPRGH